MKNILSTLILGIFFSTVFGQEVDLGFKLKKGKTYHTEMLNKSTIVQEISGQQYTIEMSIGGGLDFKVLSVKKDGMELDVKYESLTMDMNMNGQTMAWSSKKDDENDLMSTLLKRLTMASFQVSLDKNGKMKEVRNIENLFDSMLKEMDGMEESQMANVLDQLKKSYGSDAFKGNFEMMTAIFPNNAVEVGEDWDVTTELRSSLQMDIMSKYTLAETTTEYNMIKGKSEMKSVSNETDKSVGASKMTMELNGNMTSQMKTDPESGWVMEGNIVQDLEGVANLEASTDYPDGMVIPMTMKTETRYVGSVN